MTNEEAIKFGIETLEYMRDNYPYLDDERKQAIDLAIKALEDRPQGVWRSCKQGDIPITDRCTNCNYEMKWYWNKHKYCPNCGAVMQKGDEE